MASRVDFGFPTRSNSDFSVIYWPPPNGGLVAWIRAAAERWKGRRILSRLDDRMLRDIGISRSQALAEASKPFWRR